MVVEIEVGRYAFEVQAVRGRFSAPEPPARPCAEVPPEVVPEQLLAVAAVGEARVAGGRRPRGRRRRPPHAGVRPEVGDEQEEEGQGGEDDVGADEERGGGHGGFRFVFRRTGRRRRRRRTEEQLLCTLNPSFRPRLSLSLAPPLA